MDCLHQAVIALTQTAAQFPAVFNRLELCAFDNCKKEVVLAVTVGGAALLHQSHYEVVMPILDRGLNWRLALGICDVKPRT